MRFVLSSASRNTVGSVVLAGVVGVGVRGVGVRVGGVLTPGLTGVVDRVAVGVVVVVAATVMEIVPNCSASALTFVAGELPFKLMIPPPPARAIAGFASKAPGGFINPPLPPCPKLQA